MSIRRLLENQILAGDLFVRMVDELILRDAGTDLGRELKHWRRTFRKSLASVVMAAAEIERARDWACSSYGKTVS